MQSFLALTVKTHRCLTLLGVSGLVAGLGLDGPGLVGVIFPDPGLVGLGINIKKSVRLEVNSLYSKIIKVEVVKVM